MDQQNEHLDNIYKSLQGSATQLTLPMFKWLWENFIKLNEHIYGQLNKASIIKQRMELHIMWFKLLTDDLQLTYPAWKQFFPFPEYSKIYHYVGKIVYDICIRRRITDSVDADATSAMGSTPSCSSSHDTEESYLLLGGGSLALVKHALNRARLRNKTETIGNRKLLMAFKMNFNDKKRLAKLLGIVVPFEKRFAKYK